jgi:signal transduction histidine kinase
VDSDRIWFKSHHGIDVQQIEKIPGLCSTAILSDVPYVLNDASTDPRSSSNPLVVGGFGLRFYAGFPLITHDNHKLGMMSVIDFKPRTVTDQELDILSKFAKIVIDEMELRLASRHIAEQAKVKSNLLGILSHEIRTPMNGVLGMSGLLHTTELSQEQKEYIEIIEISGKSLLDMVDHILEYSKLEAGKLEVNNQPFEIRRCVSQIFQLFTADIAKKDLVLNCEMDPEVPTLLIGDMLKIRQILINLLANAIKYTMNGKITVYINLVSMNDKTAKLSFMVKDTGIGIPKDKMDQVFLCFSQAHPEKQLGGAGLGLFISKELVELMGGRIWVEESTDSGTTFSFELSLSLQ